MSDNDSADLSELEMAFARDPSSDAFLALSRAYLDAGRLMEAMVVCRKGIRAQPDSLEGHHVLARVYAAQGKTEKAFQEVETVLEKDGQHSPSLALKAELLQKDEKNDEAVELFKQAIVADRGNQAAWDALKEMGVDFDPGPTPEEIEAKKRQEEERQRREAEDRRRAEEAARQRAEIAAKAAVEAAQKGKAIPAGLAAQAALTAPPEAYQRLTAAQRERARKFGPGLTFGLVGILVVVLAIFVFVLRAHREKENQIAFHLKQAQAPLHRGTTSSLKKAVGLYEQVLQFDEENPTASARLAWAYQILVVDRGARLSKEAEAALGKAKANAKGMPATIAADTLAKIFHGEFDAALKQVKAVNAETAQAEEVRLVKARALFRLNRFDEMRDVLKTFAKSTSPTTLSRSGALYRHVGDALAARGALDKAIGFESDHDEARAERALLLLETRDLAVLPVVLDDVTQLRDLGKNAIGDRQHGYALLGRSVLNRINERNDDARRDLAAATDALGRDANAHYFGGQALLVDGKKDEGLEALGEAVKRAPGWLRARVEHITEMAKAKKFDEANKAWAAATEVFGERDELVVAKVELLGRQRKLDGAIKYLDGLAGAKSNHVVARERGRIHLVNKQTPEAIAELNRSLDLLKKAGRGVTRVQRAEVRTLLGRAYAQMDDHQRAVTAYRQAIEATNAYAQAYYYLGRSLDAQGAPAAAREAYERASKLDPTSSMGKAARRRLGSGT